MKTDINNLTIRPETHRDYKDIVSLVLRSFGEGTDYSDGTDIVALIEEIRDSEYYIPALSFVAELDGKIVGHFLFSRFPLSETPGGSHGGANDTDIVMLAPVSVHADYLRHGIGSEMIRLGIEKVKEAGFNGIIVEGNYLFYNTVGFRTSSEYGIFPVSGYPMTEPRCQMCMETHDGSLKGKCGYVVYDMYYNA
ncbi:MAG: N-acetyltransferase [Clostridia bacterium]|nr:N-acetyltransferase [Clostridia bacterium]